VRTLLSGSVATDELMTFPGRFAELIVPDQLDRLSLSFLTDDLVVRRGGTAANIAFALALLGGTAELVASVGADFDSDGYRGELEAAGVTTSGVRVSAERRSARFVCTTDTAMSQIASFYAGAMVEAREIGLDLDGVDLVMVSPNDTEAMLRHTREARCAGVPFAADTSQQLAFLDDRAVLRELTTGAAYLFANDYEKTLHEQKSGWSDAEVLAEVGVRVTTLGPDGAVAESVGADPVRVPAVPETVKADPTGVGDAFRGGFLAALGWGVGLERRLQVGSTLATLCLEVVGTQVYGLAGFAARFADTYGEAALSDIAAQLPAAATG